MSLFGNIKNIFRSVKSTDSEELAARRKETKTFEWITPFDTTTAGQVTYAFEIGEMIGFPTIWMFAMRPVKYNSRNCIGISVSLLQHPNKTQEHPTKIWSSFSTEMQRPDPKEKGFVTSTEAEDFGTRSTKGMMNFCDMTNLRLCMFPDKKLRIKIKFTLFAPVPVTKQEVRYKASKRCDSDILGQLGKADFSDVRVIVENGQEFHAYRIALARSPYFKKLLSKQAKSLNGQKQSLPIKLHVKKSYDVMKIIICFIHYGHLLEELLNPKHCTMEFAKSLVETAEEFGLPDLAEFLLEFYPGLKSTIAKLPAPEKMEIHGQKEKVAAVEKSVPKPKEID